ncbi:inorganic phosphate transporter [Effusibacillus dendaii]|uniref:Phosphate transporter n=1 Tax=Effusibacillus dendaii TaxID=2743772 RepID=A0A7I8DGG4_9BACL|nr:inorganic phosphate transporter [Effusibacillus dendaii]BCJ88442.1 sulfate permease CysP [Effusibacillus dendaii]
MIWTYVAIVIGFFFAMNIGASGTAASMGAAYGSGAIQNKRIAMAVVAVGAFLGAVLGGGEVVKTISQGLLPKDVLTVQAVIIILASSTFTLFFANLIGIPLSTSEVTVGAVVGVGIAFHAFYVEKILVILLFWVLIPLIAFIIAWLIGKGILRMEQRWSTLKGQGKWRRWLGYLLIACGFLEAFSAGMNNVANAVGPLVGAGIMEASTGIWAGGLFVALGAFLLGGKVLETNGKRITNLSLLQGSTVSFTGGTLVIAASVFGVPVPLTQATTCAILGIGTAKNGFRLWQKSVIKQIIQVWIVSPFSALVVSYALVYVVLIRDFYTVAVIISAFITTVGLISLYRAVRREKSSFQDQGGGI